MANDHDHASYVPTQRPVTTAERVLLAACGVTLPAGAATTVQALTTAVVRRSWVGVHLDAA